MRSLDDYVSPAETAVIEAITAATLEKQKKNHKKGELARRDVHKKGLIVLPFTIRVLDSMPAYAAVGLFAHAGTYKGVFRFSNGALGPNAWDALPNIRGAAAKVYGVPGPKLLIGDEQSTEFDIIFANHETFFASSIDQMLMLAKDDFKSLLLSHPETVWNILVSMCKYVPNLLSTSFFSQAPYQLGDVACKYALLPDPKNRAPSFPNLLGRNFLCDQAVATLAQGPARFTLCVQIQRANESLSNSTVAWRGAFVPVAEIEIPQLEPGAPLLDGEGLSFNPWRVLAEHRPLGWIGRLRQPVYKQDFAWRSQANLDNTT